jgi:hypothetical protein
MKFFLLVATFVVMLTSSFVLANETVGNAVAVIGSVTVVRAIDGTEEALSANGELFLNDVIQTGADGLVKLLLRDESILKVSPNSELLISEMIAGPGEGGRSTVDLLKGRIRSVIGNKLSSNNEFSVNTPVAVAGVRGTDFEVVHTLVDGEWVTGVRCFDGAVAFSQYGLLSSMADTLILPNQYSLASSSEAPSRPVSIDEGESLSDILGIEQEGEGGDTLELLEQTLDIEQVQAVLLNIPTTITIDLQSILRKISEDIPPGQSVSFDDEDVQLDAITESVSDGSQLNFDIEIPLPN